MNNSNSGPQLVFSDNTPKERNWMPLILAATVVLLAAAVIFFLAERGKPAATITPVNAAPDPYAASLPITNLVMSESSNLAGTKVTYVDGHITNTGNRIVTGAMVQVIFRNVAHEAAQNETHAMQLIRTREPYVDLESVSVAPIKPGDQADFRLIFDKVNDEWDGAYPDLRIVKVEIR